MFSNRMLGGIAVASSLVFSAVSGVSTAAQAERAEVSSARVDPAAEKQRQRSARRTLSEFAISRAAIESGRLIVVGTTRRPDRPVVLDQKFRTRSGADNVFQFSGVYLPRDCVIRLDSVGETIEALVQFCGPQGDAAGRAR